MSILDHFGINVSDHARSKAFYDQALAPLGIAEVMSFGAASGYGRGFKPDFWISQGKSSYQSDEQLRVISPVHVCFDIRTTKATARPSKPESVTQAAISC